MNHEMWAITKVVNGVALTFEGAVMRKKSVYEEKLQWLDEAINQL